MVIGLALTCLLAAGAGAAEPSAGTHAFGIYLVAGPVDSRLTSYGKGDWSRLPLLEEPIVSDQDLVAYNWETHTMDVKSGGPPHRLGLVPVEGLPFIVVANGERMYFGAFVSSLSSRSFAVPSIRVNGEGFETLVVDRGYPSASFGVGNDPRDAPGIRDALEGAGLLNRPRTATAATGERDRGSLRSLKVGHNEVVWVEKPGVGKGLVLAGFGKEVSRYRWRFQPFHGAQELSGETTLSNSVSGPATLTLGNPAAMTLRKLQLWWSGGETNGLVWYHPFREKVEVVKREEFERAF